MQRIRMAKGNAALYCALSLTLTMGIAPALTYAYDLSPQEVAPQLVTTTAGKNTNIEAAALTSFQSFGEGCEWMLDASGALTVRAADGVSGTLLSGTWPWADAIGQITSVVFELGVKAGSSLSDLFNGAVNLTSADLSELDTSGATAIDRMFKDCSSLIDVNLRGVRLFKRYFDGRAVFGMLLFGEGRFILDRQLERCRSVFGLERHVQGLHQTQLNNAWPAILSWWRTGK